MKFRVEPVERSADILDFTNSVVVVAVAQARSAKIEPQHGKTEAVQRLHGVEHDFVVQRSPKQRMRMADHCGVSCVCGSGIEQHFELPRRPVEKE